MQKQITIEQLAGYLPYNLRLNVFNSDGEMSSCRLKEGTIFIYCEGGPSGFINDHRPDDIKPYLRPLSSLTKEIMHNGETFVPLVEIGISLGLNTLEKFEEDGVVEYGWSEKGYEDASYYCFGWDFKAKNFGIFYEEYKPNNSLHIVGGIDQIQKLFYWHFDVFGLIDSGLALPIND